MKDSMQLLNALLVQFSGSAWLAWLQQLANFAGRYDAFTVLTTCGISAFSLLSATINAPTADTIVHLGAAVRARYAETDSLTIIRPIKGPENINLADVEANVLPLQPKCLSGSHSGSGAVHAQESLPVRKSGQQSPELLGGQRIRTTQTLRADPHHHYWVLVQPAPANAMTEDHAE